MSIDLGRGANDAAPCTHGTADVVDAPFQILRQSACGIEIRHDDGPIFAFTLNSAHTGLIECRRPYEGAEHEIYRAAARRFAERNAHLAGLIFCPHCGERR